MPAATVRSDYDQLTQVSKKFSSQADILNGMNQNIKSCMETLEHGDWIGEGANAFTQEMNDSVVPTLQRLQAALQEAAQVTAEISRLMKNAEENASKTFRVQSA